MSMALAYELIAYHTSNYINLSNSETTQAELEPIRDSDMTFETLHQEIGKPIQEKLQRSETLSAVI
jgi:hypothetical protein